MSIDVLNVARKKLTDALGENAGIYFAQMKLWFKMKLTKEEFDMEARSLLSPEQVHMHNDFFLALLNKVEGLTEISVTMSNNENKTNSTSIRSSSSSSRRHRRSIRSASEKSHFELPELLDYLPPNSPPGADSDGVKYAAQELLLPDHALVMGRFMLAAWEQGLDGADELAADCIVVAIQIFLKNIISTVISQRKGYKVKDKNFVYDIGCNVPNPWLRNSANLHDPLREGKTEVDEMSNSTIPKCPPTIDEMEQTMAYEMACSVPDTTAKTGRITVDEIYSTLQLRRNVLASHSIHAVNLQRMVTMLSHPSY